MSLIIKQELEIYDLDNMLWSGAKERWDNATDSQKAIVWDILEDLFSGPAKLPDMTDVNDFIWFECDDIFYPEDDEDDDCTEDSEDDDDQINDYCTAMKHENNPSCDDWR